MKLYLVEMLIWRFLVRLLYSLRIYDVVYQASKTQL